MAFFDDLSKKITDASTKTIQKGKDLTDVARLNSQISAEENRINTLYGMIGKQYMELHREDAEDAFAGLVASVAEAEQNIAACRAKITELRAVPHCPNCGAELVKGAAFCGICGTP
ncbi:zinc ribbon domain-containing protein, partial [Gemmiger sp.]